MPIKNSTFLGASGVSRSLSKLSVLTRDNNSLAAISGAIPFRANSYRRLRLTSLIEIGNTSPTFNL
ncbi:hypothetical protein PSP6_270219 [Paraburkholderia tropica]|nr:hypothetical protein PSP6_270219 [Paraburkholderia tropica]